MTVRSTQSRRRTVISLVCVLALTMLNGCGLFSTSPEDANWVEQTSGTVSGLNAVWGTAPDDVFAVGDLGTVLHFNGTRWEKMTSNTSVDLAEVCGRSSSDVYAVGDLGTMIHYDGSVWSEIETPVPGNLLGLWTSPEHPVYVTGSYGVRSYNNGEWQVYAENPTGNSLIAFEGRLHPALSERRFVMCVSSPNRVALFIGSECVSDVRYSGYIYDIWAFSPAAMFVVTGQGLILHNDGAGLRTVGKSTVGALLGINGRSPEDIYAVGSYGVVLHSDGDEWTSQDTPITERLHAVWVSDEGDVFVVGRTGVILYLDR